MKTEKTGQPQEYALPSSTAEDERLLAQGKIIDPLTRRILAEAALTPIAALIFPWRRPDVYNASPIARYKVAGLPLISVAAFAFLIILGFALYEWFTNDLYAVNDRNTLIYMGSFYVLALLIYFGSRIYRRNQGIDMKMVHSEIPVE